MRYRLFNTAQLGILLIILVSAPVTTVTADSQFCSTNGYTILTINGIFTDEDEAIGNKDRLLDFLPPDLGGERLFIDYLHNESHLAGAGDIIKAIKQKVEGGAAADDYDLVEMLRDASEKVKTRKLLLVAHSQGNFYANGFYDAVTGTGGRSAKLRASVPTGSIGVYSVATPADRVAGGGRYLTSDTDKVISGLVGSMPLYRIMPPNTTIELQDGDDALGHNFAGVYLKYKGAEIIAGIEEMMSRLSEVEPQEQKEVQPLTSHPCIEPPKLTLAHKLEGAAFAVADPVAEGALVAGAGAVKGVSAIGLAVGKISQYLANALSSGAITVSPANVAGQAGAAVLSVSQDNTGATPEVGPQEELDSRFRLPAQAGGNDRNESGDDTNGRESDRGEERVNRPPVRTAPSRVAEAPVQQVKKEETRPAQISEDLNGQAVTPSASSGQAQTNPPSPQTAAPEQTLPQQSVSAPAHSSPNSNPAVDESGRALPPPSAAVSQTSASAGTTRRSSSQADTTAPDAPSITSPANEAALTATSVTFSGTAEASSVISNDFSSATATAAAEGGGWNLSFALSQGTTTIQFYATDTAGNRSTATSVSVFVDSISPDVTLTSSTCNGTLSSAACLVATTTLAFSWSSSASDVAYFALDKNGTFSTTSSTSISLGASDESTYTFKAAAVDQRGNVSATSTQTVEVFTRPVVINEVAWAGTAASAFDEWVELYNRTSRDISFSNWTLYASDLTPYIPLSGTINAGSYFLIERTDDTTVNNITADLTVAFSGSGGSGLNNNGDPLALSFHISNATTTVDSMPSCSGGTSWCAGSDSNYTTMERYDIAVSGADSSNWYSHPGYIRNGTDANNANLAGTPRAKNAISFFIAPSGSLSSNKTLTAANSPYLVAGSGTNGLTIGSGATLTAEAGAVIKITSNNEPWIWVQGTLVTNGTASSPVVFTSFYDDEYGGDMNGDGSATTPSAGNWRRILIDTTSVGSSVTNALIRYSGNNNTTDATAKKGAIGVDSATVTFNGIVVEKSNFHGLVLENSASTVANSRFSTSTNSEVTASGVYISGGTPTISGSVFSGNYRGLYVENATPTISSNTFTSNTQEAAVNYGLVGSFSGNSGSGNGKNAILISAGTITTVGATTTLSANDLPYLVQGTATLATNSTLSFATGIVVKGWDSSGSTYGLISVPSSATLHSSGTTASNLVFTSIRDSTVGGSVSSGLSAAAAGDWKGINIDTGGRVQLSGFTLRYAGASALQGAPADSIYKGAVKITGSTATSSGSISNALFENNYQSGLNLDGVSSLSVSNTTFQNHTEETSGAATAIYARNSTSELSTVTFTGNQLDVTGSGTNVLTCSACTPASPNTSPADLLTP